ncbi:MAG TPA: MMPL family transporter, partial [Candidatus Obscuribacterales bacterium]
MIQRLSAWLVRRRWLALGLWLLLLGACVFRVLTVPMGNVLTELKGATDTEAYQVQQIMESEFGYRPENTMALVMQGHPPGPELRQALRGHFPQIAGIIDLPGRKDSSLRCWFLIFDQKTAFAQMQPLVPKIRRFLDPQEKALGLRSYLTGNAAFYNDFLETSKAEASLSELLALLFAFFVLIFTFGGLIGALLPLIMGVSTLLLFNGFLNLFQIQITPISLILTSILGLALSIDYAFFLVSRYQEEWDQENDPAYALARTLKATGKTVLVSGLLVILSSAALMLPDLSVQRTNAFNLVCVAAVATLNAVLFLPGLLVLTGPYLSWPALFSRRFRSQKKYLFWQGFARHIVDRPKRYFCLSLLLLLALAAPALTIRLWDPVQTLAPASSESMQGYAVLQKDGWGGILIPLHVIVDGRDQPLDSPAALGYLYDLTRALETQPGVAAVQGPMSFRPGIAKAEAIRIQSQLQTAGLLLGTPAPRFSLLNVQQQELMDILKSYDLIEFIQKYGREHPQFRVRVGGVVAR